MTAHSFRCDEVLQSKTSVPTLIVPWPGGIKPAIAFEESQFDDLDDTYTDKAVPHARVVIRIGYYDGDTFVSEDSRIRIVKEGGAIVTAYYE
jgi:hypothetical protein